MLRDTAYQSLARRTRSAHHYGTHVHLVDNPYYNHLLSDFSERAAGSQRLFSVVRACTRALMIEAMNALFPLAPRAVRSRMVAQHAEGYFETYGFDKRMKVVVVDLMRAGILPAQEAYETSLEVLPDSAVRQDHILLNRSVNHKGQVTGTHISGHKIGGSVKDAFVVIPDPMGATGSTLKATIELYRSLEKAKARKYIALHLIVTPEYLHATKSFAKDLDIFAFRLDRGLSSTRALKSARGKYKSEERGLNDQDYIVPGAGGIGELLNNSWI